MGIFNEEKSSGEHSSTVENTNHHSTSQNEDFAIDTDNLTSESKQGKETVIYDNTEDEAYAGEWARKLMEGAREKPEQPIWPGYTEPDPLQGPREVPIDFDSLFTHIAMFGTTGMGKSTVLKNIMTQWAFGGHGFCYIDPKGDDSKELMQMIPEDRLDEVIWIEPSPDNFDKVVGINFLDPSKEYGEEGFEKETAKIIDDIIPILRDESFWGPRMDEVVRGFLRAMLYLGAKSNEETYTLVDLYKLLTNQEARHNFAEKVEYELGNEDILQNALQKFAEIDDQDLGAARRRLQEWVISKDMQQVIAHTESKINITKAVEDGKIIIVRTASISDQTVKKGVATVVIRRIWAAIQMRDSTPQKKRDPFFLCIDEFDDVVNKESDIDRILSKARSYKLGTVLANQQPHQLPREVQEAVFGNCNTLLALNPRNHDDARAIAKTFETDTSNILELGKYQTCTKIEIDGEQSDVFLTNNFAPYPPVRTLDEAMDIVEDIVDRFGVEPIREDAEEVEGSKFDPNNRDLGEFENQFEVSEDGHTMNIKEILRAIYTAQIREGGAEEFVTVDEVEAVIEEKTDGAANYNRVSNILVEKIDTYYLEKQLKEDVELRLSNQGQQQAFTQDTGDSASAGKQLHRYLLQLSHETFTRLGYEFEAPEQVGGEQPDGLAEPPINPIDNANSAREMQKLTEEFDEKYPHMKELFGYDGLNIEAEKSTESKPKQPLKNLIKAVENGNDCVFVVPDGKLTDEGRENFDYHAKKIYSILKEPPMVSNFIEREDGAADRHFYNKNSLVTMEENEQRVAVKPDTSNTIWRHDVKTDELILQNSDESKEPYAVFDNIEDIQHASAADFELTGQWNQKQDAFIVQDKDGNEILKVESTSDKSPTQRLKDHGYSKVKAPFIPENEFPNNELPSDDQWHIIVIPSSERDFGPRYVNKKTKEMEPVFENDTPLSSDKIVEPDEEIEKFEEGPEPDVSSERKDSTNEVVKRSDDVYSKPDENDDEYNPAKDNNNFRTGYNEERMGENYTGGDARTEDIEGDFENYEHDKNDDANDEEENGDEDDNGRLFGSLKDKISKDNDSNEN